MYSASSQEKILLSWTWAKYHGLTPVGYEQGIEYAGQLSVGGLASEKVIFHGVT
jgi:hypothetical protein